MLHFRFPTAKRMEQVKEEIFEFLYIAFDCTESMDKTV